MNVSRIIEKYYEKACNTQREIGRDAKMIDMLANGENYNPELVMSWMRDYGLWQGIKAEDRNKIVSSIPKIFKNLPSKFEQSDRSDFTRTVYSTVFMGFYDQVNRNWLSASSKLLWCKYPHDFVIFDAFVERAVIVMQWFDAHLEGLPRLGAPPKKITPNNISEYVDFYMRYSDFIWAIFERERQTLEQCRVRQNQDYQYDIRILDKILWFAANRYAVEA